MITWDMGSISLPGSLTAADARDFARALNVVCSKQGYRDVELDFKQAYPVRETFMVPAIALIRDYRRKGFTFDLVQPENVSARNIFHNANWAYLINDLEHAPTTFDGEGHLPASSYTTSAEQTAAVDKVMSMILKVVPLQRKQLVALEWSVSEISDNVLNHSQSAMGGVIQASTINVGGRQMVEFVVADAGIGIRRSLNELKDVRALERAVQEGVTRNPATNQGNGLFGTFRVSTLSRGKFELHSYHASLIAEGTVGEVRTNRSDRLYPGTIVLCRVGCDDEKLIESALKFKGKVHDPGFDYIEKQYESQGENALIFVMKKECSSFGSREAGIGTRVLIENLLRAEPTYPLVVDFSDVLIVSSSFADEVFGRLFVALGPMAFMSRVQFRNVDSSVRTVLDRAISQRMSQAMDSRRT
jgi:anti-sigma regulatory factor (Ser/Thr protein kinase)/anti-anti-sigma regulatory factor